ncbi:MAG TPA: TolC family protein, partial [Candidatus Obscuribacterales bacterium]
PIQANNALGVPSPVFLAGVVPNPPAPVRRQVRKSYTIGFRVDWNYPNLGVPDAANVMSAKAVARQVTLQANQQLLDVLTQVRQSYLNSQTAEKVIDVASAQVVSSAEQLRLARVRLANGVGINLDVIQAQQAWVQALANKANAIIDFNIAQAQLLRDMGIITVDTLTSGRLVRK